MQRGFIATAVVISVAGAGWGVSRANKDAGDEPTRAALTISTEQEWIVADIARVICEGVAATARMAPKVGPQIAVKTAAAPASDLLKAASIQVVINGESIPNIEVVGHVWRAENYVGIARALLEASGGQVTREPEAADSDVLAALTQPRLDVLLTVERRISDALATDAGNTGALQDAALLVAYLGLREAAYQLTDVRPLLNRAVAHLALAHASSPPGTAPTASGRMAGIVIDVLAGRDDLALEALDRWTTPADGLEAWKAALRYRATSDWRRRPREGATLLERLAYARAVRAVLGASRFLDEFENVLGDESDWHRIGLQAGWSGPTIETENLLIPVGLRREIGEIDVVWRRYHSGEPAFETLISSLGQQGPGAFRAVDWSTWADLLQRHLSAQLLSSARQLFRQGLAREADAWLDTITPRFGTLRWFPLIVTQATPNRERYRTAFEQMRSLQQTQPQYVTPRMVNCLSTRPPNLDKGDVFPRFDAWFTPHVPTGTAYDLEFRSLVEGCPRPVPLPQVARWASMRRGDMWPSWSLAWLNVPGKPSFKDVQAALAPMLPYDARASRLMLDYLEGSASQYEATARTLCALDVDACPALGWRLMAGGRPVDAAAVYDDYATRARDRVAVSASIGWLIGYYWDNGQREQALALAKDAGETGSAAGMAVYGEVLERQGQSDEARQVFERLRQRYDDGAPLAGHYMRLARQTGNQAFLDTASSLVKNSYPNGIEPAEMAWLPAPPTDGVVFATFTLRAKATGLRPTDIIVAVDGYRVHSYPQYNLVVKSSFEPRMTFFVWRDGRSQRVVASVPQRTLGAGIDTHPAARPVRVLE